MKNNKKPQTLMGMMSVVIIGLGIFFVSAGIIILLFFSDALLKDGSSGIDLGLVYIFSGAAELATGFILSAVTFRKIKKLDNIISKGFAVNATVKKIRYLKYTRWIKPYEHPYIIYFTYNYRGEEYSGKSLLIWEKPSVNKGEKIKIFIDFEKPKYAALKTSDAATDYIDVR